jgi:hypothetical protein
MVNQLQKMLIKLQVYVKDKDLCINAEKSEVLVFNSKADLAALPTLATTSLW